jgi:lipid A 3-O-deacylase
VIFLPVCAQERHRRESLTPVALTGHPELLPLA